MYYHTDARHFSGASGICHKIWDYTLHSSDSPAQSPMVMPLFPSHEALRGVRDALTGIRDSLQERAPALYPGQPGAAFWGHRAVQGSATQAHPGDSTACDG